MKRFLVLCLLLVVLFVSQFFFDVTEYFDPTHVEQLLKKAGMWAPLLYMFAMALAIIVSPIPSLPLNIAAGAFFGPYWGTLYSALGALVGATGAFFIARSLGREAIMHRLSGHISLCRACSDQLLTRIVFVSRLIPFISFDVVSYGAGVTRLSYSRFALATFFGMLPLTFVYNYFGSAFMINRRLAIGIGAVIVVLFFALPHWIEKRNPLDLQRLLARSHGSKEHV